jgi:lipid II:glycine glycyltransferase (peptidoglycan interpeptide bridge formation enzyme)
MYFEDSSYEPDFLHLCPNNLLHWTAMKMAIKRGITTFNMGGGPVPSRFTQKFGGSLQPYLIYRKSFLPFFEQARRAYHFLNRHRYVATGLVGSVGVQLSQYGHDA